ncbi:MAG TPA: hypothetical protein VH760_08875 [Gaiellaceae bacterium]|jgi:hypothetical protein
MPSGSRFVVVTAGVVALLLSAAAARGAATDGVPACKEVETTEPAADDATGLILLQSNAARPTFDIALADKSDGDDQITFTPTGGMDLGRTADVAAELTDFPRRSTHRLHGLVSVAAHPSKSGERVVVEACLENVRNWDAGQYKGTVSVYGPTIADFSYAVVITSKWPWWVAVAVIGATVIFSLLIVVLLGPKPSRKPWKWALSVGIGFVVGVFLAALSYWSVYVTNDTWGEDPQAQIVALVMASFAATVAGYGAIQGALAALSKKLPSTA